MNSFLSKVIDDVTSKFQNLNDVVFILPSYRSIRAIRTLLAKKIDQPIFSPEMVTIEELMGKISGLNFINENEQQLKLFNIYKDLKESDEDFSKFQSWANTVLGDFNEIDRYLIDQNKFFEYLIAIERIQKWSPNNNTTIITQHLEFLKLFPPMYNNFKNALLPQKKATQGLFYRLAPEKLEDYIKTHKHQSFLFVGLNALNESEKLIISALLEQTGSKIYWDLNDHFFNDNIHDAGYFMNRNIEFFSKSNKAEQIRFSSDFLKNKTISITGAPKNSAQAQMVGKILRDINLEGQSAALVLADENLLPLLLNVLPASLEYNISMGYPIHLTQTANFINTLFILAEQKTDKGFHHKSVISFLTHPITSTLVIENDIAEFIKEIKQKNYSYVAQKRFKSLLGYGVLEPLFQEVLEFPSYLKQLKEILLLLESDNPFSNPIERESSSRILAFLNSFQDYLKTYPFLENLKSFKLLLSDFVKKEKINFKGNPDKGLQIMGLLETRAIDFDTVILTSLNEGILPAGKSVNSYIPYDIKREFGLPTVKEKDAVYAYHFYRLLQRAKNVHLIYNTEPDVLNGGEPSRFIHQILADSRLATITTHTTASLQFKHTLTPIKQVSKTPILIEQLKKYAQIGFSPTSLSDYIKNPYTFYKRHILKIVESDEVDENIAYNVLGSIIHDSLEKLYEPLVGIKLTSDKLIGVKPHIEQIVFTEFEKHYPKSSIVEGKNLIVYNVILKYLKKVVEKDLDKLQNHDLKIIALEEKLIVPIHISSTATKAKLKGKLDRIDCVDGQCRIIDYKTGNVDTSSLKITTVEELFTDPKYSQAFQLLCYVLMKKNLGVEIHEAGILPIKKTSEKVFPLISDKGLEPPCSEKMLKAFEDRLILLYEEILDPAIPFIDSGN